MINTEKDRNISPKKILANMFGQLIAKNRKSKTLRHFSRRVDIIQNDRLEQILNLIKQLDIEVIDEQTN